MKYSYKAENICPSGIDVEIENNIIKDLEFIGGGCQGNLNALGKLIVGMDIDTAIETFKGNTCGRRGTSCVDQFAKSLEKVKLENK